MLPDAVWSSAQGIRSIVTQSCKVVRCTQGQGEARAEWQQRKRISDDTAKFSGNVSTSAWASKTKLSGLSSLLGTHLAQQLCGVTCKLVCGRQRHSKANKRDVPKRQSQG